MAVAYCEVEALRELLASPAVYAVLDVRERGEFALQQIPDTTPLARGTLEYRVQRMVPRRDIPITVLCDDGRRSALAAATLRAMGYVHVQVVRGGLQAWMARGWPTREGWGVGGKAYGERVAVEQAVPQVSAEELAARRARGEPVVVVDVRTAEEFLRGHVPAAYHIPGGNLPREIGWLVDRLDAPIVVSCAGRTRGILAAQLLREAGFTQVAALRNGAMGWRLAGLPLEEGPGRGRPAPRPSTLVPALEAATARLAAAEGLRRITLDELDALQAAEAPYYLVDIRLPEEYAAGHPLGAINLPAGQLALHYENHLAVRRATVVLVGDDPVRPVWAAALCQRLGFPDVRLLDGGLAAWTAAGRALERGDGVPEAFGLAAARARVPALTAPALAAWLAAGPGAPLVLDVRGSGEFGVGHVPGARWLARGKLELLVETLVPDRAMPLVTVCDTGVRAALAAATLAERGYRDVAYLDGGLAAWRAAGLPLAEGLDGADVSVAEAQNDFGHTLWSGALGRSRRDMERYLTWEERLAHERR
jgi:rhodanese-related sulfurtransferase